jgi:hypothetical protein
MYNLYFFWFSKLVFQIGFPNIRRIFKRQKKRILSVKKLETGNLKSK